MIYPIDRKSIYYVLFASKASLMASPSKLSDRTIVISIMQGINRYAVSVLQYLIASERTNPNVDAGGFMPTPRKEKTASAAR